MILSNYETTYGNTPKSNNTQEGPLYYKTRNKLNSVQDTMEGDWRSATQNKICTLKYSGAVTKLSLPAFGITMDDTNSLVGWSVGRVSHKPCLAQNSVRLSSFTAFWRKIVGPLEHKHTPTGKKNDGPMKVAQTTNQYGG